MHLLVALFCLATFLAPIDAGGVLKLPAVTHRMPPKVAAHRRAFFKKDIPLRTIPGLNPKFKLAADTALLLNQTYTSYIDYLYLTNISIGTPAQVLTLEIDPWYDQEMCVLGAGIDQQNVNSNTTVTSSKKIFDKSLSSSFVDVGMNVSMWACGRGKNGTDLVQVGDLNTAVTFGVIQNASSYLKWLPGDGILGLNPMEPYNNSQNTVSQLLAGLDSPIMTWWQNETDSNQGVSYPTAQLTLGAEDTDHCKPSYVYAPKVIKKTGRQQYYENGYYPVHLTSAVILGDADQNEKRFDLNTTLTFWHGQNTIYGPPSFFNALLNATNAVYNSTAYRYLVDCNMSKHKDILLNIGGSGATEDETSRQIVLSPAEYIYIYAIDSSTNTTICSLRAYSWYDEGIRVELNQKFLNNHCLAYNAKEDMIGFSEVKNKQLTVTYY